jgi:D-alanine-D-alanine ligase
MIVGLTFDLKDTYLKQGFSKEEVAEFDSEETISGLENTLNTLGYQTERIGNIVELTLALAKGKRWDIVFNIAEGLYGIGRETQVPALLDAFQIPYVFSNPVVLGVTLHKAMAKHIVKGHGIPTADFCLVNNRGEIDSVQMDFPLFIKPVAEGTGKGIGSKSLVNSKEELQKNITELLEKYQQAVLVEEFLPGREFTVGITGTGKDSEPCGIMEVSVKANDKIYSLYNKENYQGLVDYSIPEKEMRQQCFKLAVDVWKALECQDGGRVDIKLDKNGVPNFIEVNPLAGLNPIHSDLPILCRMNGISYTTLIEKIMNSALKRLSGQH